MEHLIRQHARDGIVARKDLIAAGLTRSALKGAEEAGPLVRLSRSLFATAETAEGVVTAVAAGGTLTCLSALELLGVWTLGAGPDHHVRRKERRRRDGPVPGAQECRSLLTHRGAPVDSLDAALVAVVLNHSPEDAVVALDCVLQEERRTRSELEELLAKAPAYARRLLARATGLAESPLESVVRYRLGQRKVRVRSQHRVPGVGRFDLLIGERILVELDGFEHHRTRKQFREDRRRDRRAPELGYVVLRFTWEDVMHDWSRVLREILTYVSSDFHRRPPRGHGATDPTRRPESAQGAPVPLPSDPIGGSGRADGVAAAASTTVAAADHPTATGNDVAVAS
ncbi:hypothetical protein GCM10028820_23660 [Tessaracoccus terricola]